jgi:hypothetical protein
LIRESRRDKQQAPRGLESWLSDLGGLGSQGAAVFQEMVMVEYDGGDEEQQEVVDTEGHFIPGTPGTGDQLGDHISQPSHRLTGFSTKKALASVWLRATRHGYENKKPTTEANEA